MRCDGTRVGNGVDGEPVEGVRAPRVAEITRSTYIKSGAAAASVLGSALGRPPGTGAWRRTATAD